MPRYLVVANLTLGGEELMKTLRERVQQSDGDARLHVLVPASSPPAGWRNHHEEEDTVAALRRMKAAIAMFNDLHPKEVTGEIGAPRPIDAIGDVIRANTADPFDEIILSTLPSGPSRWLSMDLPARIGRQYDIPLTHIETAITA